MIIFIDFIISIKINFCKINIIDRKLLAKTHQKIILGNVPNIGFEKS